jgi:hypothetical protein
VQGYYSVALGVLLSVAASIPARAETDLTGKWVGPFNGVQVEIPLRPGPFGWESGEARKSQGPRFIEASCKSRSSCRRRSLQLGPGRRAGSNKDSSAHRSIRLSGIAWMVGAVPAWRSRRQLRSNCATSTIGKEPRAQVVRCCEKPDPPPIRPRLGGSSQ